MLSRVEIKETCEVKELFKERKQRTKGRGEKNLKEKKKKKKKIMRMNTRIAS